MNEVLAAAKSGSVSAINELLVASERYIRVVVNNLLGTKYAARIDADDVCQEVLIKVATGVAHCRAEDWQGYLGWLSFVARNATYTCVRSVKCKKQSADETVSLGEWDVAKGDSPEELAVAKEQAERFNKLASEMGEVTERVVEMLLDGDKVSEISAKTGLSANAVSCIAYRYRSAVASLV